MQQKHSAKDVIESKLQRLEELRRNLTQVWEERRHMLTQCRDLQVCILWLLNLRSKFILNVKYDINTIRKKIPMYSYFLSIEEMSVHYVYVS